MVFKIQTTLAVFCLGLAAVSAAWCPSDYLTNFTSSEERIRGHGYPVESHFIETVDGYVLNLFRIPYSHKLQNQNERRPAVLLQHGLFSNSDCWLTSGPDNSLAYLLADAGFDVWLGNARGNIYSRKNNLISLNSPKFWHFDWHEIGTIDIAAMIDYMIEITGEPSVHYAGHSQGTTVYFVLMSERPEYNKKITSAHMLAPCAFFGAGTSFIFKLFTPLIGNPNSMWNTVLQDMELMPKNALINRIADTACGSVDPKFLTICRSGYFLFVGDGYQNVNISSMQILIETHPGGSSSNQGIHYIQMYHEKEAVFRQYDWGTKKNMALYNQPTPPDYQLSNINDRTHLYSSFNDALCAPDDVDNLVKNMPQLAEDYRIPDKSFNHLDFIVASNMKEYLNDRVVASMLSYE